MRKILMKQFNVKPIFPELQIRKKSATKVVLGPRKPKDIEEPQTFIANLVQIVPFPTLIYIAVRSEKDQYFINDIPFCEGVYRKKEVYIALELKCILKSKTYKDIEMDLIELKSNDIMINTADKLEVRMDEESRIYVFKRFTAIPFSGKEVLAMEFV